ncbi:MAG TPA: hypothetical protein VF173_08745 [Thermoanaerobaculia bacterium]|nr:hypothetical protein [Thermoanaerobaculia bacterium]
MGRRQPTLKLSVSPGQLARWQRYARLAGKEVPAYLRFAAEWTGRYLRDRERGRSRADPVLFRQEEKRRLEALVRAAKGAYRLLPGPFLDGVWRDPEGDLRAAVIDVEWFWQEHGEAYGI